MPIQQINLLSQAPKLSANEERMKIFFGKLVPGVLLVFFILLGGVLAYWTQVKGEWDGLEKQIVAESSRILALSGNEREYLLLKQKTASIGHIFSGQVPFTAIIRTVLAFQNEGVSISSIGLGANSVEIVTTVKDTPTIDQLILALTEKAKTDYQKVELRNISLNEDQTYSATFFMELAQK